MARAERFSTESAGRVPGTRSRVRAATAFNHDTDVQMSRDRWFRGGRQSPSSSD